MTIWLIEDDWRQAERIHRILSAEFPDVEFKQISTERAAHELMDLSPPVFPDIAIVDVMLPWTEIEVDSAGNAFAAPPPLDYDETGGLYRAGMRIIDSLWAKQGEHRSPAIVFTVLSNGDLSAELEKWRGCPMYYLSKKELPETLINLVKTLIAEIRQRSASGSSAPTRA
jgi:CheY-like chemotaxis protein